MPLHETWRTAKTRQIGPVIETPTETIPPPAPHAKAPRRLSVEIEGLLGVVSEQPITLRQIIGVIQGRAYTMLLILLSLPFLLPLPLPGLSTAVGAIIFLIGLRLSLRLHPWLPDRALDAPMEGAMVTRVLKASRRVARWLEVLLKPRWSFLVDWVVLHHVYGVMICICALLLMLPLPIPFSNLLPSLTIIFLAAALIERDGVFVVAGIMAFILTLMFFSFLFVGGVEAATWLEQWFGGIFDPDELPPPELPLPLPATPAPVEALPPPAE